MKVETKESLKVGEKSYKASVLVFDTLAEAITAAKGEDVLLKKLNAFLHAHGTAADIRDMVVELTEEISGVKPLVKDTDKKNAKGEVIKKQEDPMAYVMRVTKPEVFDKVQAALATRSAKGYSYKDDQGAEVKVAPLALSFTQRMPGTGGAKKLAAKWKDIALLFLNETVNPKTNKPYNLAAFNKTLAGNGLNEFVLDKTVAKTDAKNVETLGWLCKAYQDSQDAFSKM